MPPYIQAVLFDFGDTLADEGSEVKDANATTQRAELIPGAGELVRTLAKQGYRLALVADGRLGTYTNVLGQHDLLKYFETMAISELVGVEKPDPRMYQQALNELGIGARDYPRVVMVGNRLDRDVRGANQLGLISVWIDWAPRYGKTPADEVEVPRFTIREPLELLPILEELEATPSVG